MTTLKEWLALNRELGFIQDRIHKLMYGQDNSPRAAGYLLHLQEREMQLLERIGKLMDGPP